MTQCQNHASCSVLNDTQQCVCDSGFFAEGNQCLGEYLADHGEEETVCVFNKELAIRPLNAAPINKYLAGCEIEASTRHFGVTLDQHLTMSTHVINLCRYVS